MGWKRLWIGRVKGESGALKVVRLEAVAETGVDVVLCLSGETHFPAVTGEDGSLLG
jgi:hypothetical protein